MAQEQEQPRKPRSGWRTFGLVVWITTKWLFIFGITGVLLAGGVATGYVAALVKDDPVRPGNELETKVNENALTGFVYFNDGKTQVGQLRTNEDRRLAQLKDIPQSVIDALLATEDNNFYTHIGVDYNGLGRAIKQKLLNEDTQTGGSTLTQQVARRVFLNLDRSDSRKFKEILLAVRMERYLTKDQILAAYLNKMPFGNGSTGYNLFGIKSAAIGIFNISDLKQLNLAQSAYLAGLPQLPSAYSAFNGKGEFNPKGFERAMARQKRVLSYMLETGRITQAEHDEAVAFNIKSTLAPKKEKAYNTYPYLMLETERQAAEIIALMQNPKLKKADLYKSENSEILENAREQLLRSGYRIHTTIDKVIYDDMREIASNPDNFGPTSKSKGPEQAAAIMINHRTGAILGMMEGRDFNIEQMNYATQMTRQPGSAMKPIAAYLPALEAGLVQPASVIDDSPIILKDGGKGYHIPKNSTNKYYGLVTARDALNRSLNIPALKLFLDEVTIKKAWDFTRSLGITTLQPSDESAQTGVIGGLSKGVSVEELTNAYASIPNGGKYNDPFMISKIVDANGRMVYEHKVSPKQVYSEQTAFLMGDMLRTVISDGRGTARGIKSSFKSYGDISIAGKTGTTQNYGDVWFVGFSPDVTLGVWVGYKEQKNTLVGDSRKRPQALWSKIMNASVKDRPELFKTKDFPKPDGLTRATVSSVSGLLPSSLNRAHGMLTTDWFNKKYVPVKVDDVLGAMSFIKYNGVNYIAQEGTPSDFVYTETTIRREKPLGELMKEIERAQAAMPAQFRKPLSYFVPLDADKEAPSLIDPRKDDGNAPSAPSNVALEALSGAYRISFSASPEKDVVGYRLYRSSGGDFSKFGGSILTGDALSFTDNSGINGASYYVTAVDVAGRESGRSQLVSVGGTLDPGLPGGDNGQDQTQPPSSPTGLSVTGTGSGVQLQWNGNSAAEGVTHYQIYFSAANDGNYQSLGSIAATSFEYVAPITTGTFIITAVNAAGESGYSPAVTWNAN
ncbi:transglycosylase domain-containing protein [Paenibacillus pasadenensis]|uniref:penicillin-binding protein 1A n=1 Tax=Paenibacillus pasadenensis TaxID=217090 RepID=UPI00203BBC28|nr:penicillin-binding protein 1A [Paenibacillus pasadenensis]MCM3746186.1 transglycosylase domain-containing protein [Paenibacillus pasadenensis]